MRNTLLISVYTLTVAILGFSLGGEAWSLSSAASLSLLPMVVVVPVSLRVGYYRDAIAKLSAYQVVFLEPELDGINWETRNNMVSSMRRMNNRREKILAKRSNWLNVTRYSDFPLICLPRIPVFVSTGGLDGVSGVALAIIAVVILIFEIGFIHRSNNINAIKSDWCKRWNEVKLAERKRLV